MGGVKQLSEKQCPVGVVSITRVQVVKQETVPVSVVYYQECEELSNVSQQTVPCRCGLLC